MTAYISSFCPLFLSKNTNTIQLQNQCTYLGYEKHLKECFVKCFVEN